MKHLTLLFLVGISIGLSGCAHTAKVHKAPDATRLRSESTKLSRAVVLSRNEAKEVSAGIKQARAYHTAERVQIIAISEKVAAVAKVAPAELLPQIEAVAADVAELQARHDEGEPALADLDAKQSKVMATLEEANAAKNEVERLTPAYFADVEKLAQKANDAEAGWARDSKSLHWYRLHWWGSWIVLGLGVIGCAVLAFLKATGRLAMNLR